MFIVVRATIRCEIREAEASAGTRPTRQQSRSELRTIVTAAGARLEAAEPPASDRPEPDHLGRGTPRSDWMRLWPPPSGACRVPSVAARLER